MSNPGNATSGDGRRPTCTGAGILSTLAMLPGQDADTFLDRQGLNYWSDR